MNEKQEWLAVQLPKETLEECELMANSPLGKKLGFTKKAQVVNAACREFLNKNAKEYFFDLNSEKNDDVISFMIKSGKITCQTCTKNNCEHVNEIKNSKRIQKIIKNRDVIFLE